MNAKDTLAQIWGYQDFRPPQGEIVEGLLQQRDTLIVMPTGGGKSICFQLPALLSDGLTIVVSPLVALMENQVQELTTKGLPAGLLHSELPSSRRHQILQALEHQRLKLLYLSPETLLSPPIWERLCHRDLKIHSIILDEAHCLVHWGETFRPSYRRLGAVRRTLLEHKPPGERIAIAAFTATADPFTQATIKQVLELDNPAEFILNPHRSNLRLQVQQVWTPKARREKLAKFIAPQHRQAGLIYVRTRNDSENLARWLTEQGDTTAAYHAGLSPQSRRHIESAWLTGKLPYVVCTCAFGMGINKPDVRWIAHFQPPVLLAEYIQEIGRAGRDGKPAEALMLTCEPTGLLYPEDRQRHHFFTTSIDRYYDAAKLLVKKIPDRGDLNAIERQFPQGGIALSLLHSVGALIWETPFRYQQPTDRKSIDWHSLQQQQRTIYRQIPTYLNFRGCRWFYLLTAFGANPSPSWRCGNCDRCLVHSNVKQHIN
jgi:ATP-dependent DNA helicase RecQ